MSAAPADTEASCKPVQPATTGAWEMTANAAPEAFGVTKNCQETDETSESAQTTGDSPSRALHAAVDGPPSGFCSSSLEGVQENVLQAPEQPSNSSSRATSRCNSNNKESSRGISMFAKGVQLPRCSFSFRQMNKKGEDQAVAATPVRLPTTGLDLHIYAVFDGHGGQETSQFCRQNLVKELLPRLRQDPLPPETEKENFQSHLKHLRHVVLDTFLALNRKAIKSMLRSGCTASVVLVTGWLVTVANVGDSLIGLETADGFSILSADHRLNENPKEVERLLKMGRTVAQSRADGRGGPATAENPGRGSLRVYPGGLNMARAIGDEICGEDLLPYPYITQLKMPTMGGRLIIASDGVWDADACGTENVAMALRMNRREDAASAILQAAITPLKDDTTLLIVDVLSPEKADYTQALGSGRAASPGCLGRLFSCGTESGSVHNHKLEIFTAVDTMPEGDITGQAFRPSDNKERVFSVFQAYDYSDDSDDEEDEDSGNSSQPGLIRRLSELPELWRMQHAANSVKLSHLRTVSINTNIKKIPGSIANVFTGIPSFRTRTNKVSNATLAASAS